MIEIRMALPDDWRTIVDFNTRLAFETEGKSLVPETITAGVKALIADSNHGRYFVATENGQIVGQLMHTREWSDWRNGEIWWIQSVYVHSEHRRRGIFRSLYEHLAQQAEATPYVVGLRLYVETHNAQALETYEALGFVPSGHAVMERMFRSSI